MSDFNVLPNTKERTWLTETMCAAQRTLKIIGRDLELAASVYLARFIVWRELRRRRTASRSADGCK